MGEAFKSKLLYGTWLISSFSTWVTHFLIDLYSVDGQEIKVEIAHGRGSSKPQGGRGGRGGGGYGGERRGGGGGYGFGGGER